MIKWNASKSNELGREKHYGRQRQRKLEGENEKYFKIKNSILGIKNIITLIWQFRMIPFRKSSPPPPSFHP